MNRMNISKSAMFFAAMIATASCFAMRPTKGWMSINIPKITIEMPLSEGPGTVRKTATFEIFLFKLES